MGRARNQPRGLTVGRRVEFQALPKLNTAFKPLTHTLFWKHSLALTLAAPHFPGFLLTYQYSFFVSFADSPSSVLNEGVFQCSLFLFLTITSLGNCIFCHDFCLDVNVSHFHLSPI